MKVLLDKNKLQQILWLTLILTLVQFLAQNYPTILGVPFGSSTLVQALVAAVLMTLINFTFFGMSRLVFYDFIVSFIIYYLVLDINAGLPTDITNMIASVVTNVTAQTIIRLVISSLLSSVFYLALSCFFLSM